MALTTWTPTRWTGAADVLLERSAALTVWRLRVPREGIGPDWTSLLTDADRAAADRIVASRERNLHAAGRVALRLLLGSVLRCDPGSLRFEAGRWGKPRLVPEAGVAFNLAHSGDLVLLAIGGADVGVDVERSRPRTDVVLIASRFYGEAEASWVESLEPDARREGFLRLWTRKEAVVKALGLALPMYSAEALVLSDGPRGSVTLADRDGRPVVHWLDLDVGQGYSGAVAVVGSPPDPELRELHLS